MVIRFLCTSIHVYFVNAEEQMHHGQLGFVRGEERIGCGGKGQLFVRCQLLLGTQAGEVSSNPLICFTDGPIDFQRNKNPNRQSSFWTRA